MAESRPAGSATAAVPLCPWLQLQLPASLAALAPLQAVMQQQAQLLGFDHAGVQRICAACDEALATVLRLGHDAAEDASNELQASIRLQGSALELRLSDNGLPYDLSLLPRYDPEAPETADEDGAGLAAFLMQRLADHCEVLNQGQQGHHVLLQWMLPQASAGVAPPPAIPAAQSDADARRSGEPATIRPMQPEDAIHLARLMFRTYGYSYTNPDMYTAEGIRGLMRDGRLTSWVAVHGEQGVPVGHIALLKPQAQDPAVEIGTAVVAPSERGSALFTRLVAASQEALPSRPERVAFLHAVAAHPYTQKTFNHLGYHPTALLLGLIPGSASFRGLAGRRQGERVSAFHSCKLLHPVDPLPVWLPPALLELVQPGAQAIGLALLVQHAPAPTLQGDTRLASQIVPDMGAAFLTLQHAGQDLHAALARLLRQLCRARLDVVYLHLDAGEAHAPATCAAAQALGFIPAGLTPFMPWPATLCLQYLNNLELDEAQVHAVGPAAEALRGALFKAWRAQEWLD
ncbi:GNAT family N-acetyltransferase [Comamonas sp. NLF-1-9]|uniref:GNAT family N-acetyltransferase n=1 Tax=Comamonas sp. NLF-1-9 TaxID=2853163 RepID=UPI001C49169D|nr:GNAT family N-acetyltransferase [Comamonas sp. NLF-1-9]QXL85422.1 ATP-binding protein [Comamonas sp. NLF-1-9]